MKDFLIYLAQTVAYLSFFLLVYATLLRRHTFYKFNRMFLLTGVASSFLLPLIKASYDVIVPYLEMSQISYIEPAKAIVIQSSFNIWQILIHIYLLGATFVFIRNLFIKKK